MFSEQLAILLFVAATQMANQEGGGPFDLPRAAQAGMERMAIYPMMEKLEKNELRYTDSSTRQRLRKLTRQQRETALTRAPTPQPIRLAGR